MTVEKYEAELLNAQDRLDHAKSEVTRWSAERSRILKAAIADGVTIYRLQKTLGVNRRVIEKAIM